MMRQIVRLMIFALLIMLMGGAGAASYETLKMEATPLATMPIERAVLSEGLGVELGKIQDGLTLDIRSDKESYQLGEPVILYVTMRNEGQQTASVLSPLDPEYGFVNYMIVDASGEERRFLPYAHIDAENPSQQLAPGEEIQGVAKIFFGGDGWTFEEPGSYQVYAAYQDSLRSNTLTVQIDAATDQNSAEAADLFLGSEEVGKFLYFEGGDHLKEGVNLLEQVARQFPDTPHATYANFALGNNLLTDFANFQTNQLRRADPTAAVQYLEVARENPVSSYYTVQTYLDLSQGYQMLNQPEMAEEMRIGLENLATSELQPIQNVVELVRIRKSAELNMIT
ncbi:MAG: hypothetical protein A4E47_00509 [Methanosaeta sp. PtaU1.Bin028]|nr:MAG: hypothetical protein A4E47_00509 [Methanosaeta sp. PtaU1.Bin028]